MTMHLLWLWFWFLLFMSLYWLKRAFYMVTGPNPVANSYPQFIQRCWAPLLIRAGLDSLVFWLLFTPGLADKALTSLGWTSFAWAISGVTQFAPFAATFGYTVDSVMDTVVSKVPGLSTLLPQMPGPLPSSPPTDKQVELQKEPKL